MPKQSIEEQMTQVENFLLNLGEHMGFLKNAIRDEDDEEIRSLMNSLPTKREITTNLTLLGKLLEGQPWKKVKRNVG